jgi:hypothetical protein
MSRREAILLVSRALATIQLISTFLEATELPDRFVSLHHYASVIDAGAGTPGAYYFKSYDEIGIALNLARIAGLMIFAFMFWNCGPWVERFLLPTKNDETKSPQQSSIE